MAEQSNYHDRRKKKTSIQLYIVKLELAWPGQLFAERVVDRKETARLDLFLKTTAITSFDVTFNIN